jgi:hypothetical protein
MNVMAKDSEEFAGFGRYAGPATLILSSLADGTKHGYALTKDIESFAGVRLAPGTLYEALARLEAQGMIEGVESHDRREPDPGEGLDVLGEGVAVLGAVGQARQDQRGRPRVPAESGELLAVLGHDGHLISASDLTAGAARIR